MSGTVLSHWIKRIGRWSLVIALLAAGISGCGGGAVGASGTSGTLVVGVTDAEGDFLAYQVDAVSVTLTRADGAVVETLPQRTRIDFAQYVEMTEFFTAVTVPSGVYTAMRLRLDYTGANVVVEDATGAAAAAIVRDRSGNPVTTLDLNVRLDGGRRLVIAPGVPAHLTLDFNLAVSNHVDLSGATPVVTVDPFLIAEVQPEAPKPHRARGPLKSVDTANSRFEVFIRPFHSPRGDYGTLTVAVNDSTAYEINGSGFQGGAGLTALAAQPALTAVIAIGQLDAGAHRFLAEEVYAGSSVPYGTSDVATGAVVARSGDVLTVRGALLLRADGSVTFRDTVAVTVADTTLVAKQTQPGAGVTKDDISIGSRVSVFGTAAADGSTLDATQGLARLLISSLTATVNSVNGSELELNLQTLNGRRVALYGAFAGTGTPGNDASPGAYQVDATGLTLTDIVPGSPVRVRGFVKAYGQAPADFLAQTVINVTNLPAQLLYAWDPATAAPFVASSASAISLNPAGVGTLHHIVRGGVATDVGGGVTVAPQSPLSGLYAIGYQGTVQVYLQFNEYEQALAARLGGGQKARYVGAHGAYTDATTTLSAGRIFTAFE